MTQNQLNREVAHATGESVGFIRSLGFSMVNVPQGYYRPRRTGAQAKQSKPVPVIQQPKAA
jgi:hypothetical protein